MSKYTSAERAAQIVAAAVQVESDADVDLLSDLVEEADIAVVFLLALMCGRAIREYDDHMRDEHGKHFDREKLAHDVRALVDEAVRKVVGERLNGPHPDTR